MHNFKNKNNLLTFKKISSEFLVMEVFIDKFKIVYDSKVNKINGRCSSRRVFLSLGNLHDIRLKLSIFSEVIKVIFVYCNS